MVDWVCKKRCYNIISKWREEKSNEKTNTRYDDFIIKESKRDDTIRTGWKDGVTDKAVSKWERDLSYPDINTIPKLADLFDTSVDELMQGQTVMKENKKNRKSDIVDTVLRGLGVAMGIVVVVLSALGKVDTKAALTMLGLGLASLSISSLKDRNEWE